MNARGTLAVLVLLAAAPAPAAARPATTEQRTATGDQAAPFSLLRTGPGSPRVVRRELGAPRRGRESRRRSLLYFAAIDEIHYTDEESPARVEFLDKDNTPFTSAWKPNEALRPFGIDQTFRTLNALRRSALRDGRGRRAAMALALVTGDSADNQQFDEQRAVRTLLEGGRLNPNTGRESGQPCPAGPVPEGEAARYTGVQDYGDYRADPMFYDPDQPLGRFAEWPRWPGLMDRAQRPFTAAGLRVPSYLALGNHDRLQQGNAWVNSGFAQIAVGCSKPFAAVALDGAGPETLLAAPEAVGPVPADPDRRSLSYPQLRALFAAGRQSDAHGFGYVAKSELEASAGAASYYAWSPRRRLRFVALNTVSEGGTVGDSAEGNIDDPQFRWLERELAAATRRRQLVVLFAHHPIASLRATTADENAPACSEAASEPGCDLDPRDSRPLHGGPDLQALLLRTPGVVAYIAGHTGAERLTPFKRPGGGGFWQIESGSASDWPMGARLLELFDNRDGTLSLQTTLVNAAGPVEVPPSGTPAAGFGRKTLAAVNRVLVFNDYQTDSAASFGKRRDRNAELLLDAPRR